MREELVIRMWPGPKGAGAFQAMLTRWRAAGCSVSPHDEAKGVDVCIALPSDSWRAALHAAATEGVISPDWSEEQIRQVYAPDEIAQAPAFRLFHTGRNLLTSRGEDPIHGVCHITSVDLSAACDHCGAGARQAGPLVFPPSELNKSGRFASDWHAGMAFFLATESLLSELEQTGQSVRPLRPVEASGRTSAKEQWWQLDSELAIPLSCVQEARFARKSCPGCGAIRLEAEGDAFGGYFRIIRSQWGDLRPPPIFRSPFWDGVLERFQDGRVVSFPQRELWLRGDFARSVNSANVPGIELMPVVFADAI
jgi:hypothetical protein